MMRTRSRVGVAVRREEDGAIVTESFDLAAPSRPWHRMPLLRGVFAIRTALSTGRRSMEIGERLRWEETVPEGEEAPEAEEGIGLLGKAAIVLGALLGAGLQIALFRIGPIVIAKEAGLTGAGFIVADAFLRLILLLATLMLMSLLPPFRKILKYHGAEHQTIAAHESGRPLTAAAAAGFSRFHPRCGTSFMVVSALVSIAVYGAVLAVTGIFTYPALIATRIIGAPLVTAIAFELQRQASRHADGRLRFLSWPGMAAQRLTTARPGPEELDVACAALAAALREPQAEEARAEPVGVPAEEPVGPAPALGGPQPSI